WGEQVKGTNRVTVNLGGARARVNIYDPTMAAAPARTLSNASSVPLLLSDHPVIIELPADGSAPNSGRVPPHPG
ncbi:MAG TPA: hypothetical protein VN765_04940, partial [Candidatus Acidoferrum sp.]|nr:hypothetical protein [Candidatus Acidoferrum sp.]